MRKTFAILALIIGTVCCLAHDYEPNTNWPYVLSDFEQGTIYNTNGTYSSGIFNINLYGSELQCLAQYGEINSVQTYGIDSVVIAKTTYRYAEGKLMEQVMKEDSVTYLLKYAFADFDEMLRLRMPYGISGNTSATENVKRLNLKGVSNEKYDDLKAVWYDGARIPVIDTYVFLIGNKTITATQKNCNMLLDDSSRKELKSIIKSQKLKWNNLDNLMIILRFMKDKIR